MTLDEPKSNDEIHKVEGFTFVIDKDVVRLVGDVTIDVSEWGIELYSGLDRRMSKSSCSL
jgi:Fe-S cluster assembly iron-binding protein IscA